MMSKSEKNIIAVIAAHPDDEALGAGGTIAKHARNGDAVHILFLADGVGARDDMDGLEERHVATFNAAKEMGVAKENVHFEFFPDNRMDSVALLDVVKKVEAFITKVQPNIIYTHHAGDLNIDHVVTAKAVMTACRPLAGLSVKKIYGFEVLSSTEWQAPRAENAFLPSHFVNITDTLEDKMKCLKAYDLEMRPFPHSRSYEAVRALAVYRGVSAGYEAAEAFTVIRSMED